MGIRFQCDLFNRAWGELLGYVQSGRIPFETAHGCGVFQLLGRSPDLAQLYAAPMAARSSEYSAAIAAHPALNDAKRIIDVANPLAPTIAVIWPD